MDGMTWAPFFQWISCQSPLKKFSQYHFLLYHPSSLCSLFLHSLNSKRGMPGKPSTPLDVKKYLFLSAVRELSCVVGPCT